MMRSMFMMRRARFAFTFAFVCSIASSAIAQTQTPEQRQAANEYALRVRSGVEQLMGGDTERSIQTFREAIEMDGARPEAQYFIACAHRMSGRLEEAVTSFQQTAALAQSANQPRWRMRALHGIASTLERMPGRVEDARTAWQEYSRFADANQTVADPQLGRARIQAIDMMNEQEQVYVQVRQRIAEREQERAREERERTRERRR
jgi:tetratricopeptide (TPR) repeat protein